MPRSRIALALTLAFVTGTSAWAQVDEVVVTGARISGDDYSGIPAVVLQRRGDFLVQRIRLTNDTRAEDSRIKELQQTIRDMVSDAARKPGIALSYGDEFLIPISATATEIVLSPAGKRPDTSSASIYVKMALGAKDNVPAAIASLTAFIKKARISGRTEIELEGEVGLSLVTPEKYRYEIISRITEDAKKLKEAVGSKCRIQMSGLANRVSWQRSDVSELTLYIPYQIQLAECE
ncbi:MAG TPA: hypothetical protein VFR18_08085 [Terriglobia bacterium]|nr:hypothetical protein [Terriglobia bacterium]